MKFFNNFRNLVFCLFILAGAILPFADVVGQEEAAEEEESDLMVLEEFVVTATKRERTLQEVHIAVTPYSAPQLGRAGVKDIRGLMAVSPSLFLTNSQAESTGVTARIRGIGTGGDNPGYESAVGVFVDGVYRSRNNVGLTDLGEVERIEVLRGPQGTLFGRNTLMGLINVITKGPSFEPGGYAQIGYGNFNNLRLSGGIEGGLIEDVLAGRLDAMVNKRDGTLEDITSGENYNDRDRMLVRGQLLLKPGKFSSVRIIGDYAERNEQCCAAVTLVPGPTVGLIQALGGNIPLSDSFNRTPSVNANRGYQEDVVEWGLSTEITLNTSVASITSITAFRDWETVRSQDIDYTNLDIGYRDKNGYVQGFETFTQELRAEVERGWANWLVGLFYISEDLFYLDSIRFGTAYERYADGLVSGNPLSGFYSRLTGLPPGQVFVEGDGLVEDIFWQKSESWSLFTHNTFTLADDFEVTLGVRYAEETKDLDASLLSRNPACSPTFLANVRGAVAGGVVPPVAAPTITALACLPFINPFVDGRYSGGREEKKWSSTASVAYHFSDDDMLYGSYSRGFKAGAFNLDRATLANPLLGGIPSVPDLEVDEELVDSYEIGGKFGLFARRATLNATLFLMDLKDFQLTTFTGTTFVVDNLEKVKTKGVELETTALLARGLTVRGALTYADTKYGAGVSKPDLAGQQLTHAPKWTLIGSSTYERNLSESLRAFLYFDMRYMSSYNTGSDLDIEKVQDSFAVFNGRIGIAQTKGAWKLELWAKNLFNKDYVQIVFDAPLQGSGTGPGSTQTFDAFLGAPRTFGATLRKQF